MKKINMTVIAVLAIVVMSGFNCNVSFPSGNSSYQGAQKEVRDVAKFNSIGLSMSAHVILRQGSEQKVEVEASADDLAKTITEVQGNTLKIKTKPGTWKVGKVTIYITIESLKSLAVSGSGSIESDGSISCDRLDMAVSGSGNINLSDLKASELTSAISGSGNIKLSGGGTAHSHKIAISGSGNLSAENFATENVEIGVSGSGNCRVNATENLKAGVSGSGDVYYKGGAVVNAAVSGSGKVRSIN